MPVPLPPRPSSPSRAPLAALLVWFCFASSTAAQEPEHSPFGCEEGAVRVTIDREPALTFEPAERPPRLFTAHEFVFNSPPFRVVRIYLTATLAEESVGRESTATLSVYAETESFSSDAANRETQWWQLVRLQRTGDDTWRDRTSHDLLFQATRIASCFGAVERESECAFADVSLATRDENLPLIVIGFTQNLGGANANNWTDASLLLDFRSSPPRVATTLDCAYNEGGGACTAIDSGMTPRSTLQCNWARDVNDFLCTETTTDRGGGHRDFHLFANRLAPRRPSELSSLQEAAAVLAGKGKGHAVPVYRLGPVSFVEEITTNAGTNAMLLAAGGAFYLAPRSGGKPARILGVVPRGVLDEGLVAGPVGLPEGEWTGESTPEFKPRIIFRQRDFTLVQVVQASGDPEAPAELYWIGIQHDGRAPSFDAMRLVSAGRYEGCGRYEFPAAVVSIGDIAAPFRTRLRVQPATIDTMSQEVDLEWHGESDGEKVDACVRNAIVSWKNGRFETAVDPRPCTAPDTPRRVHVQPDGRLRVETARERKD